MKPEDRTGQVWEIPAVGTVFMVTGPPWRHKVLGWQHPSCRLVWGDADDGPQVTTVQETPHPLRGGPVTFEDKGWKRLF